MSEKFASELERKARRKSRARERDPDPAWTGLGAFGLVGWSVAVPTVLGVGIGVWLDRRFPGEYSWTLMMLALGVMLGCANAWHWVNREQHAVFEEEES